MATLLLADAGPLVALAHIQSLLLPQQLGFQLLVPAAVFAEATYSGKPQAEMIRMAALSPAAGFRVLPAADDPLPELTRLGLGEASALRAARDLGGSVLMDDLRGRRMAARLGLSFFGTLALLNLAREQRLVASLHPLFEALLKNDYWLPLQPMLDLLARHGEAPSPRLLDFFLEKTSDSGRHHAKTH